MNLTNYIKVYKNVVSDSFCDKMIQKFEDNPKQYHYQKRANPVRNFKMSFNQIHIHKETNWKEENWSPHSAMSGLNCSQEAVQVYEVWNYFSRHRRRPKAREGMLCSSKNGRLLQGSEACTLQSDLSSSEL